jgi:hypothetical protein
MCLPNESIVCRRVRADADCEDGLVVVWSQIACRVSLLQRFDEYIWRRMTAGNRRFAYWSRWVGASATRDLRGVQSANICVLCAARKVTSAFKEFTVVSWT